MNQQKLVDPTVHPDWVTPHSDKWYDQLGSLVGEYKYPWNSEFEGPTAADRFTQSLTTYLTNNSRVLDVGCGHGQFTFQWATKVKEIVGIDVIEGFIETANKNKQPLDSIHFLKVNAKENLPFSDHYFDVVYTK